jgi:hypothetical protein
MRRLVAVLCLALSMVTSAVAQVNIGINLSLFPELVPVPGYPVYYAPRVASNFFFYDGLYWVYHGDNWYASSWYNGPWRLVAPAVVPLFVLRIPVRYYRHPPAYFLAWRSDAPPRWGEYWGHEWERRRAGWDRWNRSAAPAPAPLPLYQRQYSGERYPRGERQQTLHNQNYRYQPRDAVVQQHYHQQKVQGGTTPSQRGQQAEPQQRSRREQETQRSTSPRSQESTSVSRDQPAQQRESFQRSAPAEAPKQQRGRKEHETQRSTSPPSQERAPAVSRTQPPQRGETYQRSGPAQVPHQQAGPTIQRQQGVAPREQAIPKSQGQDKGPQGKGPAQKPRQGPGSEAR